MDKQMSSVIRRYYGFSFLTGFHFIAAVLIPFFTDWGGLNLTQAQLLQSWFALNIFVLEVPTGVLADRMGRKNSLVAGSLVAAAGALIYGSYPSVTLFVIGESLLAVNVALVSGADQALIYDALKLGGEEQRITQVVGRSRMFHLSGILIAAPLGSIIAQTLGTNAPMLMTSIPCVLSAVVAWTLPEADTTGKTATRSTAINIFKNGFIGIIQQKMILMTAINMSLVAAAAYAVIWRYQLVMETLDIPIGYYGLAHASLVVAETVILMNFDRLTGWFGTINRFASFSAYVVTAGFLVVAIWPNILTLAMFLALAGGFGLSRIDLLTAHMNHRFDSEYRATSLSSISMFRRLSLVILNPIMGGLTDWSLSYSLIIIGLLPLLTIFFPLPNDD
ncbi:hypothetical protein A2368_00535 [Candidatus Collierbacteria bacterium RIFOXYB1_FULL_49_13]|uniref:Major facilitator superfamily (MFS) profile domain-containing protein n=1 Tax=Candidatus Collierbacteria bacterium RIFOXYB1_FULL_49_13 TaxID=1817728 RepID=A0A1F5FHA1_9BACT|nr:MAG: hypothetical protein A2368_00535 [Candidatus Collierbacteria bacterium RIFOXYB1_FULL_49_13]